MRQGLRIKSIPCCLRPATNIASPTCLQGRQEIPVRVESCACLRTELDRYLLTLDNLGLQLKIWSRTLSQRLKLIMTASSYAPFRGRPYTALMIKSEIGDIARFASSDKLCIMRSGSFHLCLRRKIRTGRITKRGSKWLRKAWLTP